MSSNDWLAERFDVSRPHLPAVTYRILGSAATAKLVASFAAKGGVRV